jgi:tRNA pseudouridine13 synthase
VSTKNGRKETFFLMSLDALRNPPTSVDWPLIPPKRGGILKTTPRDFVVEEVPSYLPSGEGDFVYLWVEKEDMASGFFVRTLSRRANVPSGEIGLAGQKDRRAITRQWVSMPLIADVDALSGPVGDTGAIRVLSQERHSNKLRTGHLRGNHFQIGVRELAVPSDPGVEAARALIAEKGFANVFGPQRFGRGDTVDIGLQALAGTPNRNKRLRRLGVSAVQSSMFNHWLEQRHRDGLMETVLEGDVLQRRDTGGVFVSEEPDRDGERLTQGEVGLTGPMFGWKTVQARGPALDREMALLTSFELTPESFRAVGKLGKGTRRPAISWPQDLHVSWDEAGSLNLSFFLSSGCYATVLCRLLCSDDLSMVPIPDSRS